MRWKLHLIVKNDFLSSLIISLSFPRIYLCVGKRCEMLHFSKKKNLLCEKNRCPTFSIQSLASSHPGVHHIVSKPLSSFCGAGKSFEGNVRDHQSSLIQRRKGAIKPSITCKANDEKKKCTTTTWRACRLSHFTWKP